MNTIKKLEQLARIIGGKETEVYFEYWCDINPICNDFFETLQSVVSEEEWEEYEVYCLKATNNEMVNHGLQIARGKL